MMNIGHRIAMALANYDYNMVRIIHPPNKAEIIMARPTATVHRSLEKSDSVSQSGEDKARKPTVQGRHQLRNVSPEELRGEAPLTLRSLFAGEDPNWWPPRRRPLSRGDGRWCEIDR
jgi:hypothetical protein